MKTEVFLNNLTSRQVKAILFYQLPDTPSRQGTIISSETRLTSFIRVAPSGMAILLTADTESTNDPPGTLVALLLSKNCPLNVTYAPPVNKQYQSLLKQSIDGLTYRNQ